MSAINVNNSTTAIGAGLDDLYVIFGRGTRSTIDRTQSNDFYQISAQSGEHVTIDDRGGSDTIGLLPAGEDLTFAINTSAVNFARQGNNLVISVTGIKDFDVTVVNHFTLHGLGVGRVEAVEAGQNETEAVRIPDLSGIVIRPVPVIPGFSRSQSIGAAQDGSGAARQLVQAMAGFATSAAGHAVSALQAARPQLDLAVAAL